MHDPLKNHQSLIRHVTCNAAASILCFALRLGLVRTVLININTLYMTVYLVISVLACSCFQSCYLETAELSVLHMNFSSCCAAQVINT